MKFGLKTLAIVGIVLLVMGLEAAVIYLLFPKRTAPQAAAGELQGSSFSDSDETDPQQDVVEVPIDTFNCTNTQVASGSVVHVRFKLVAVVANEPQIVFSFDEAANKKAKTRVRQAVEKVIRKSTLVDLYDADQSALKRQIREEINKILGTSYVIEVVISDFTILEQ